jgi:very-short-patch-repair endonuclease
VVKLAAARPNAGWTDARSSEVTMLKREMAKRKHHKSFRRLASEIPNLLQALKPCLMMSPLSVSQYLLTAPVKFDLVIFDEASQIPPEEAIPAILRARQMIVAGDAQQLPPTPFFQSLGDLELEEWQDSNTLESLLQEASVVLPEVSLRWHYRSRHEALPAFSNHYFYEDRLITFPNAVLNESERGVCFVHVPEGIYDRAKTRTNPMEARRVAELVLEHFQRSPERSLGVVTFSQPQREAVDMEVQNLLRTEPGLEGFVNAKGSDAFFVKSLENVQGDERDVMIFSVGYGKDVNGSLTMNFGPLNGEDGARRLNVAITRARDKVILVSSLLPSELDLERTNSRGVHLLRAYMEYAMRGGGRLRNDERRMTNENARSSSREIQSDNLREQVREALLAKGYEVHAGVGVGGERVDLALVDGEDPNRYALGIEFDGETFRRARTARDRERLRTQVLENLGWRMYRLRAKDWAANPARQLERILQLMAALETPSQAWSKGKRQSAQPASDSFQETGEREPDTLVPTGMMMYRFAELERQGTPEQFFRAEEGTVQELFVQLAEQEGPVHWNAAARRIAGCWGITRVTTAVENHLDEILSDVVTQGRVVLRDDFLWSPVTMDVMVRRPGVGQEPRPIEEIAPEEIAKAAYLNLKNALSLTEEDWVLLTARVLGFSRVTERVKRRILGATMRLELEGMIIRQEEKVVLNS